MSTFLNYFVPGAHFHLRNQKFLGDLFNVFSSVLIVFGIFLYYGDKPQLSGVFVTLLVLLFVVNIWRIKSISRQLLDPALIKFQELEFREIISNYLKGNQEITLQQLNQLKMTWSGYSMIFGTR